MQARPLQAIDYSVPWSLTRPRLKCEDCGVQEVHSRPNDEGKDKHLIIEVLACSGCGRYVCKRCLFRHQDFFRHSDHHKEIDMIPPPVKPADRRATSFTREHIDRVLESADIVRVISQYVALRKVGHVYWGLCPFHKEKSPSFNVRTNPARFHCFGCGEGGDVIAFIMKKDGLTFREAVKQLGGA